MFAGKTKAVPRTRYQRWDADYTTAQGPERRSRVNLARAIEAYLRESVKEFERLESKEYAAENIKRDVRAVTLY